MDLPSVRGMFYSHCTIGTNSTKNKPLTNHTIFKQLNYLHGFAVLEQDKTTNVNQILTLNVTNLKLNKFR